MIRSISGVKTQWQLEKKGEVRKKTWHGDKRAQNHKNVAIAFLIQFSYFETFLEGTWYYGP